ncbi:MAG: hypothetical protein NZZ41_05170 [Candidatus Dojkabacteria bacterium]|nr:hypothetical protein [Candidatus Dojkabacteria bacterium]
MNQTLTERQKKILMVIIREFIETAEAVGSISLLNKYNFNISSATIRNEMAELVYAGFLYQKYTSGGRIPTTKGWRFFVNEILKDLPVVLRKYQNDEIKYYLSSISNDSKVLIKEAISLLHKMTKSTCVAILESNIYYSGLSSLVDIPEFKEESTALNKILEILEDYSKLSRILNAGLPDNDLNIIIAEESGIEDFNDYAIVFSEIRINNKNLGYIASIGPTRMKYDLIIGWIKNISDIVKLVLTQNQ